MRTAQIRQKFLDYFARQEHEIVPSSPLVPDNDDTLLFTNAGMVQFKGVFLGEETRNCRRAVTAQRCVRAGGKHNDLENVGYTARHHTFFEMLGNFSFGDYFKEDAIRYAWELLTEEFRLPPDKLWVTVFEDDEEAESVWVDQIGLPGEKVARIGARDNFWQMGDTGPCGPCSEIFYDHGPDVAGGPPGTPDEDGDRFVEIWNLVFMQFNRSSDGTLEPLPAPSVDTGMGLERMAAVLQGVHGNYEIDLFRNLIRAASSVIGINDLDSKSLRVIADHIRSTALLIADGVMPSNEGRGYVLRRIIRRAVRHGYQLGCREPFMHRLVDPLLAEMGTATPELAGASGQVKRILEQENGKFNETLEQGLRILDQKMAGIEDGRLPGDVVFTLYDTYGFPVDLTADVAREHGLTIDHHGFESHMADQRERARSASRFGREQARVSGLESTRFVGYRSLASPACVRVIVVDDQSRESIREGEQGTIVLDRTPFYAESGGQAGDRGTITFHGGVFTVEDTRYLSNRAIGHVGRVISGDIRCGQEGMAQVDDRERTACALNHSATHLLHAALRQVLGTHVEQKGSLVESRRLRFDYAHFSAVTEPELEQVESLVNEQIRANHGVSVQVMDLDAAKQAGAAALFGEKYDSEVRTIRMGEFSFELCGGTHVERTGDIGFFKIVSEAAIASGIRRIEALTGHHAQRYVSDSIARMQELAALLKVPGERVEERVRSLVDSNRQQQKQIQDLQAKLAAAGGAGDSVREIRGVKVVAVRLDDSDVRSMRMAVDQWRGRLGNSVVVVAGAMQGKVTLIAGISKELTTELKAGDLIRVLAPIVGGKGGGRAELAQGGGARVAGIESALAATYEWVESGLAGRTDQDCGSTASLQTAPQDP